MTKELLTVLQDEIEETVELLSLQNSGINVYETIYKTLFDEAKPVLAAIAEMETAEEKVSTLLQCVQKMVNDTGQDAVNYKNQIAKLKHKILVLEELKEKFNLQVEREKKSEESDNVE